MTEPEQMTHIDDPAALGARGLDELTRCWVEVTNTGGAVGFPRPPVSFGTVAPATLRLAAALGPGGTHLVVARDGEEVTGWVALTRNADAVVAHWATVRHLQVRPAHRGRGLGGALMRRCARIGREVLGLDQLHLSVRGGEGLERFYTALGWREVGRWPGGLRMADDDVRDEVLFVLPLT